MLDGYENATIGEMNISLRDRIYNLEKEARDIILEEEAIDKRNWEMNPEYNENKLYMERFLKEEMVKYSPSTETTFDISKKLPELNEAYKQMKEKLELNYDRFIIQLTNNLKDVLIKQNEEIYRSFEKAIEEKEKERQKEILLEANKKEAEDEKGDNNTVKVFRFVPLLWSKKDPKEQDRLRESLNELNQENKLKLNGLDGVVLDTISRNQELNNQNNQPKIDVNSSLRR